VSDKPVSDERALQEVCRGAAPQGDAASVRPLSVARIGRIDALNVVCAAANLPVEDFDTRMFAPNSGVLDSSQKYVALVPRPSR
jgi:hypothetical protein